MLLLILLIVVVLLVLAFASHSGRIHISELVWGVLLVLVILVLVLALTGGLGDLNLESGR